MLCANIISVVRDQNMANTARGSAATTREPIEVSLSITRLCTCTYICKGYKVTDGKLHVHLCMLWCHLRRRTAEIPLKVP